MATTKIGRLELPALLRRAVQRPAFLHVAIGSSLISAGGFGITEHTARFLHYLHRIQEEDLTLGVAMTDAKGDRRLHPHQQSNADSYVHIVEYSAVVNGRRGIVISGTKAIVTGAPYMHELLVMPCRNMGQEDADFAVCCAVPIGLC